MDGKSIDYVIDFATYAIIPAFFFYKAEMVTASAMPIAITLILMSSALYYGKKNMVEDEQYFMGFPVLWNFVVFFQFFLVQNHQLTNLISVVIISILHFVPIRFAYPSMSKRYFKSHLLFSIIGLSGALYVLYIYPVRVPFVEYLSIIGGSYFALFAIYDTLKR
jgi:phosphatidylcholine synthase